MADLQPERVAAYLQGLGLWTAPRVERLECISTGWESDVHALDVACDAGGVSRLVVRLYPGAFAEAKATREYAVIGTLHAAGYPVPNVFACERSAEPLGHPFLVMERVAGSSLGRLYDSGDAAAKARYLEMFCGLLARLHALDWRLFVADDAARQALARGEGIARSLRFMRRILEGADTPGLAAALSCLEQRSAHVSPWTPALVHWDYHGANILVSDTGAPAVLDWTSAEVTDPRFDLAWTLLLNAGAGSATREAILTRYAALSGREVKGLDWFEDVAIWRRLASVAVSLRYGAARLGMRPGAETLMRRHLGALGAAYERLTHHLQLRVPEVESLLHDR